MSHEWQEQEAVEDCPCCGYRTLPERGRYDICHVCFWEDDDFHEPNSDVARSGPNHGLILSEGQLNYRMFGACHLSMVDNVRPPTPREIAIRRAKETQTIPEPPK